jgi:transketolase
MIVAHTIKGKGISFAENRPEFHNGILNAEQFALACRELQRSE